MADDANEFVASSVSFPKLEETIKKGRKALAARRGIDNTSRLLGGRAMGRRGMEFKMEGDFHSQATGRRAYKANMESVAKASLDMMSPLDKETFRRLASPTLTRVGFWKYIPKPFKGYFFNEKENMWYPVGGVYEAPEGAKIAAVVPEGTVDEETKEYPFPCANEISQEEAMRIADLLVRYEAQLGDAATSRWAGFSSCRLCALRDNGSDDYVDNDFLWPEGLKHYVREHRVSVPKEFVEMLERNCVQAEHFFIKKSK